MTLRGRVVAIATARGQIMHEELSVPCVPIAGLRRRNESARLAARGSLGPTNKSRPWQPCGLPLLFVWSKLRNWWFGKIGKSRIQAPHQFDGSEAMREQPVNPRD